MLPPPPPPPPLSFSLPPLQLWNIILGCHWPSSFLSSSHLLLVGCYFFKIKNTIIIQCVKAFSLAGLIFPLISLQLKKKLCQTFFCLLSKALSLSVIPENFLVGFHLTHPPFPPLFCCSNFLTKFATRREEEEEEEEKEEEEKEEDTCTHFL